MNFSAIFAGPMKSLLLSFYRGDELWQFRFKCPWKNKVAGLQCQWGGFAELLGRCEPGVHQTNKK